ncbi:MAG: prepilin-type N-terminal cleavage/methylation domain-containing protein [Candidatus Colwellbacteria bacterium]|nr:prepilin-type N-terminal cleavage/methylation domain-containing protein [Candidatus Colwellbacteria bacterium]
MKQNKGFTLIELLVVIAIISILAGVVLTGVTGFQANARDTKRIGDLKNTQPSLELYFVRCGHYPGTATCGTGTTLPTNWDTLSTVLSDTTGARISNDPLAGRNYIYIKEPNGLGYALKAVLERDNRTLQDNTELDSVDIPSTWQTTSGERNCDDTALNYCIGS